MENSFGVIKIFMREGGMMSGSVNSPSGSSEYRQEISKDFKLQTAEIFKTINAFMSVGEGFLEKGETGNSEYMFDKAKEKFEELLTLYKSLSEEDKASISVFEPFKQILSSVYDDKNVLLIAAINFIEKNFDLFLESIDTDNKIDAFYNVSILQKIRPKSDIHIEKMSMMENKLLSLFETSPAIKAISKFPVMAMFPVEEKVNYLINNQHFLLSAIRKYGKNYNEESIKIIIEGIQLAYTSDLTGGVAKYLESLQEYDISFLISLVDFETNGKASDFAEQTAVQGLESKWIPKATSGYYDNHFHYLLASNVGAHAVKKDSRAAFRQTDQINYFNLKLNKKVTFEDTLFDSGLDTSQIESKDLHTFRFMMQPEYRYGLQQRFNIDLSQLSIRTQYNLIHFFIESEERWPELIQLLDMYGSDRKVRTELMKVFTGMPIQDNLDRLTQFAKSNVNIFKEFVATYAHIIDSGEGLFETLNTTENSKHLYELFPKIKNKYIERANTLFSSLTDINSDRDPREVISEVKGINLEMISISSIFSECKKEGFPLSFDDFSGMDRRVLQGNQMSLGGAREIDGYMDRMVEIYEENIKNKEKIVELVPTFKSRAEDSNSEFHILKLKDEIIAFIVFTKNSDGTLFASGLNVAGDLRGSGFGDVMMRDTIVKKMEEADLVGSVVGKNEVAGKYLRDGAIMYHPLEKKGDINLTIVWSKNNKGNYLTKSLGLDDDELIGRIVELEKVSGDKIRVIEVDTQDQIPFELTSPENGYVITRIFKADKKNNKKMRVVLEKRFVEDSKEVK